VLLEGWKQAVPPGGKNTPGTHSGSGVESRSGEGTARRHRRPEVDSAHHTTEGIAIDLASAINANLETVIVALAVVAAALVVLVVVLLRRTRDLGRRIFALTRGSDERSLEAILEAHLTRVHQVVRELDEVEARTAILERDLKRAFSRVGLVRYNPFEDTGGNQSFALALLDEHGDGFVMSSLHTRNQTRVYAKGVKGGRPDSAVSDEEAEALRAALAPAPTGPSA